MQNALCTCCRSCTRNQQKTNIGKNLPEQIYYIIRIQSNGSRCFELFHGLIQRSFSGNKSTTSCAAQWMLRSNACDFESHRIVAIKVYACVCFSLSINKSWPNFGCLNEYSSCSSILALTIVSNQRRVNWMEMQSKTNAEQTKLAHLLAVITRRTPMDKNNSTASYSGCEYVCW